MIRNTFSEARLHNLIDAPSDLKISWGPEVKTEEGYSADIYPWRYVRTTSHEGYMSHEGDVVRT